MTLGIFIFVMAAAIFHALWNFAARKVSGNLVVIWLALLTGCVLIFPVVIVIVIYGVSNRSFTIYDVSYMISTGVLHAVYFALLSRAYERSEISVVYPIARGTGVGLTAILAWLLIKEEISILGALGIFLILIGIFLMAAQRTRKKNRSYGLKLAIYVGISIAAYSLVDKNGVSSINPIIYIWAMFVIATFILWPYVIYFNRRTILQIGKVHKRYIFVIGFGSIGTYLMILYAFTKGAASYIVAVREFAVVLGALFGIVFLKERLTIAKFSAIAAITLGLVFIKAS